MELKGLTMIDSQGWPDPVLELKPNQPVKRATTWTLSSLLPVGPNEPLANILHKPSPLEPTLITEPQQWLH